MQAYQVIISGGGPVGTALAIELNQYKINTLVIEKHCQPQQLPKAQTLNPRTLEFFQRWKIDHSLKERKLLPANYPMQSIWCDGLAGQVHAAVDIQATLPDGLSAQPYLRIPLWLTEATLREKVSQCHHVDFITNTAVTKVQQRHNNVLITAMNSKSQQPTHYLADYVVGCDGANSITREQTTITLDNLSPARSVINVLFQSEDLKQKIAIDKAVLYYNLTLAQPIAIGCVDYDNGLWYAQIITGDHREIAATEISQQLDTMAGFAFQKNIIEFHPWTMQARLATTYQQARVLLAGDAAHCFPPTGGHGLNTGFGDVVNLAWKLAYVIKGLAPATLLTTYTQERRPIAHANLQLSIDNAKKALVIGQQYPPATQPIEFVKATELLAKQHVAAPGIALGYCYDQSCIINYQNKPQKSQPNDYTPAAASGYFLPHIINEQQPLYDQLSTGFNLLISKSLAAAARHELQAQLATTTETINIVELQDNPLYRDNFYLIRPDWHIAWHGNIIAKSLNQLVADCLCPK